MLTWKRSRWRDVADLVWRVLIATMVLVGLLALFADR